MDIDPITAMVAMCSLRATLVNGIPITSSPVLDMPYLTHSPLKLQECVAIIKHAMPSILSAKNPHPTRQGERMQSDTPAKGGYPQVIDQMRGGWLRPYETVIVMAGHG